MLDQRVRGALAGPLASLAQILVKAGIAPAALTAAGLVLGLGAAVAASLAAWVPALALWLLSRLADGLDGPVARAGGRASDRGGYLDIVADFTVYGAFVVGCGIGQPDARVALLVLLGTYYVNGTAFLAFSSAVARRGIRTGLEDERTHVFLRGLTEATETIVAHSVFVLFPDAMATTAWVFSAMVGITIVQRVVIGWRTLPD